MSNGLGRYPFLDMRDGSYLMRHVLSTITEVVPTYKIWEHGDILDQGNEGACVGFSWQGWENAKPVGYKLQQGNEAGFLWYNRAKQLDEWPGSDYEGTSVRAGAKVALEKQGIESFLWAFSRVEIDTWLLTQGPIVVGSDWFNSMDHLGRKAYCTVDPTSGTRGGHAYLLLGKGEGGNYWFQNSWGEGYGKEGLFFMTPANFDMLLRRGNSEFCTAAQVNPIR
jgi:hypothetical protein